MIHWLALCLAILLFTGCDTGGGNATPETEPVALTPFAETDSLVAAHFDDPNHPQMRRAAALMQNPLNVSGTGTLKDYQRHLSGANVHCTPKRNRHEPAQTDTLIQLKTEGARIDLYQVTGGQTLLTRAETTTASQTWAAGFVVGMPEAAALDLARGLWLRSTHTNQRIVLEDVATGSTFTAFLSGGRVTKLVYEGYLD
jgi:hypothetical protein